MSVRRTLRLSLAALLSASASVSCAADPEDAVRARYGDSAYLFAGAGCDIRGLTYIEIQKAAFFEGIHRTAMEDVAGKVWVSDVYFDKIAMKNDADRRLLYQANIESPVHATVSGWIKDCGGGNVIFLADKLELIR